MSVAILCAASNSVYHRLPGVDVYDKSRDARTFPGGCRVVAHPPCRAWSAFCSHQAKVEPGERELGLWCVAQTLQHGGILEQPAHSRLWEAAKLPMPGRPAAGWFGEGTKPFPVWSAEVWQAWWGYPMRKATWLLFAGISPAAVRFPLRLHPRGGDRRTEQLMSKEERAATTEEFARWLVATATQ